MSQNVCPSCTAPNDANATFCGSCGAPLGNAQPAQPSYQPPAPPPAQPTYAPPPPPNAYGQPQQTGYQAPGYQQAGYQQPGYQQPGYAPGMDADSARALQAAQMAGMVIPAGFAPAGFWIRLGAYLIDGIILGVAQGILMAVGLGSLSWLIGFAYIVGFWVVKGQTPGKMALGLYVISTDGQPLSWGKAITRYVGYLISAVILLIGFIMIGFDDAKRGLHDRIANTLVVKRV